MPFHHHDVGMVEQPIHGGTGQEIIVEQGVPLLKRFEVTIMELRL